MAEIKGFEIHALETSFMVFDRKDSFGISYKSFLLSLTILLAPLLSYLKMKDCYKEGVPLNHTGHSESELGPDRRD